MRTAAEVKDEGGRFRSGRRLQHGEGAEAFGDLIVIDIGGVPDDDTLVFAGSDLGLGAGDLDNQVPEIAKLLNNK